MLRRSLASVAALALILTGCSSSPSVDETGETTTIEVRMVDSHYVPDTVEVPLGNRLVIELINDDPDLHDLVFENGVESERFGQGQSETIDIGVISGDLDGWCSIPPHREHGMVFTVLAV